MTFLSPGFLWFLPLVALPLLIHLLAKQKSKLIEFPSLKFLKMLEQDALRKFNIKQLILLIIRTLMILFIILAFARPNMDLGSNWNLSTQAVDLIIVALDNTASNQANFENQTGRWLQDFKSTLEESGSKVYFCGLSELELSDDPETIISGYSDIYPEHFEARFEEQINLASFRNRSIIWIGDGQDAIDKFEQLEGWGKYILRTKVVRDFGILSIKVPRHSLRTGDTYALGVDIGYMGEDPVVPLELVINDRRVNQTAVTRQNHYIELSTRIEEPGFQEGRLEIGEDENLYNNTRYFVLPAGGSIPVQILTAPQSPNYWKIIDTAIDRGALNLDVHLVNYAEIDGLNLSLGGTVIIDDASRIAEYTWNRLKSFVSLGGQLILFGAGGAPMQELLGLGSGFTEEQNRYPFGLYMTETGKRSLHSDPLEKVIEQDRLKVFRRFNISAEELEHTWLRFLDDQPFLGSRSLRKGRIVWFNTEFQPAAGNLPLLGIFPALINQLCQYQYEQNELDPYNAIIGDPLQLFPSAQAQGNALFSIQRPDGTIDFQPPDSNYVIRYHQTDLPGIYRFLSGRKVLRSVAVNISPKEARAHYGSDELINSGFKIYENRASLTQAVMEKRKGFALWPILLIILFLLWMVETYLARIKSTWRQHD